MKKLISPLLILTIASVMYILLNSCGGKKENYETTKASDKVAGNETISPAPYPKQGIDNAKSKKSDEEVLNEEIFLLSEQLRNDPDYLFTKPTKTISKPPTLIPETREELESIRTVTKLMDGDLNFGVNVPGFGGIKLGKKESSLSIYYIETKVVDTTVYGIGYSVHYLFKKLKKGLSLSDLSKVAASVQLEHSKTEVYFSLQSYGVKSYSIVKFFKPIINKKFDVEGFGIMQSNIDGIHNVLSDSLLSSKAKFKPMILDLVKPADLRQ